MVAVMAFMFMGLVSMPAHAGWSVAQRELEVTLSGSTITAIGNMTLSDAVSPQSYIRVFEQDTTVVLAEAFPGPFSGTTRFDFNEELTLDVPVPGILVVQTWAYEPPFAMNKGSKFWRLVNNWLIPSPELAFAAYASPALPPNIGTLAGSEVLIESPVIALDSTTLSFTNTTDSQQITVTNDGAADLTISAVGVANALPAPFVIVEDCVSGGAMANGGTCGITVSIDLATLADAKGTTHKGGGLLTKAGLGSGIIILGLAFGAGSMRRRRVIIGLFIVLVLSMGLLQACGSSDSTLPYYLLLDDGPTTYTGEFEVASNDPDDAKTMVTVTATLTK